MQTPVTDSNHLIQLIQDRREEGLDILYRQYGGALLHLIMKIIPEKSVAEELLQDTFVKIWNKIDLFDSSKGRFFTWMAQIARNTSLDKKRLVKYQNQQKTDTLDTLVDNGNSPSTTIDIVDSGLKNVIGKLDPDKVRLIELLYYQGYSQKDASEELNIPLGTVKTRARAAIKELRIALGGELGSLILMILSTIIYL